MIESVSIAYTRRWMLPQSVGLTVVVIVLPRLLVVVTTFPPPIPGEVPLVLEVPFVPEPPELTVPLPLLPVAAAAPVVVV